MSVIRHEFMNSFRIVHICFYRHCDGSGSSLKLHDDKREIEPGYFLLLILASVSCVVQKKKIVLNYKLTSRFKAFKKK